MKKEKAITLISLVITIIVLIILTSVAICLSLSNNGIFTRTKEAKEVTNKQEATEKINLKITTAQMNKYAEKQEMPTLQELADLLYADDEIQYVALETRVGSKEKITVGDKTSIFTKLNKYPYEFEINSSLQLASINGVKIATGQTEIFNPVTEVKTMPVGDLFKETTNYIDKTAEVTIAKSGNIIQFIFGVINIPHGTWTTIGVLKDEYCPKVKCTIMGLSENVANLANFEVETDGTISVIHGLGRSASCYANFIYILNK